MVTNDRDKFTPPVGVPLREYAEVVYKYWDANGSPPPPKGYACWMDSLDDMYQGKLGEKE